MSVMRPAAAQSSHRRRITLAAAAALAMAGGSAFAAVDTVVTVVNETNATDGKAIGTFAFDPTTDTIYVGSFGFTAPGANATLKKITNVGGTQVVENMLSEGQLQLFYRDGNPDRSVTNPTPSGMLLNPLPIGTGPGAIPAYGTAVIVDLATTRLPSSTTTDPLATKRFYRWNLQSPPPASPTPPPYGDGRDVMTTVATLADLQAAASTTNAGGNIGRQFAFSGDGQSIYAVDTSTAFGGVYKINLNTNAVTRISTEITGNTEPAVLSSGGVDTIFARGGTANEGGIDKITHDGITTSAAQVHVTAAAVNDFLENTGTTTAGIASMAADSAGNLYFNNTTTIGGSRRGIFKLDPQGRMSKVVGYEERKVVFGAEAASGNPNANTLRMQPRTTNYVTGGGSFEVTQILYAESSGVNAVAGAYVFKTGDFNRDNAVDQTDIAAFKEALTLRGVTLAAINPADHDKFRFDLNGNDEVSWKDVKILQQFYGFLDGDANIDQTVNIADFSELAANFNLTGKKWTEGDFTGDEVVGIADFSLLASNFNLSAPSGAARPGAVPEPATLGLLAVAAGAMLRRRRA